MDVPESGKGAWRHYDKRGGVAKQFERRHEDNVS